MISYLEIYGPNGEAVAAHIEKCKTVSPEQAQRLSDAWNVSGAAWKARDAAWQAAWNMGESYREAAWNAQNATWNALDGVSDLIDARDAAWHAALALVIKEVTTENRFNILYGPWRSVMEVGE